MREGEGEGEGVTSTRQGQASMSPSVYVALHTSFRIMSPHVYGTSELETLAGILYSSSGANVTPWRRT